MRFKEITFENYRCFLNGTIEFPVFDDKNMTVLVAPNGGGKTETLFAFWWTLYDFDFSKLTNKEQTPYAINSELYRGLEQSEVGTTKYCSITLKFENDGTEYIVTKRCEYRKTEKQIRIEEYRQLSYYNDNGELSLPIRDKDEIIKKLNRIIPKQILYGIIFDGERMQKLNTPNENSINAIKGVISDITNVELLENCTIYFESIKRKLNKRFREIERKAGNNSLQEIISNIVIEEKELKETNQLLEQYTNERENIVISLDNISEQLERNNEVREIEIQRKSNKETLETLDEVLTLKENDLITFVRMSMLSGRMW